MRTTSALFLLFCFLPATSAFLPSSASPRTPTVSSSPMTNLIDDKSINGKEHSWRRRFSSILPSMLRPTGNKKKRRALASLLVAASFAFSQPVAALSSKPDVATCVKQRAPSKGMIRRKAAQRKSTSDKGDSKLAVIPVSSEKEGFWTKRRVIMFAAGGGTVLGLSLVPPVKDEDGTDENITRPALEVQAPPLPSSITKEAFRELEELFGGGEIADPSGTLGPEKVEKSSAPSIEEDVRVISDPSAENVNTETPAEIKLKGVKAVKKVTPIIEEADFHTDIPPSSKEVQDSKVEKIVDSTEQIRVPVQDQSVKQDDAAALSKKEEATRKVILEERLRQTVQEKQKPATETDGLKGDVAVEKSKESISSAGGPAEENRDSISKESVPGNEANVRTTAEVAALSKKEEAARRAILEERLKEEAKRSKGEKKLRKVKEEVARRALLGARLKQENIKVEAKKNERKSAEKSEDLGMPTPKEMLGLDEGLEADASSPLSKDESSSDEPIIGTASEGAGPTFRKKLEYRQQPLSPDEEAALQKKYSSLPLKERAYRILVDLGMIDSSSE